MPTGTPDPHAEDYELLLPSDQSDEQKPTEMGQEEQILKSETRRGDAIAYWATLSSASIFVFVTWIIVLSNSPFNWGWFAFHPLFQSLSMILFMYGILTLQPTVYPKTKAAGLARHQLAILFLAVPLITFGTLAVWYNKWREDAYHFTTWHGKFGLISMIWMIVQIGIGGGSVWFGGAAFGGGLKAKLVWKYHRLSGYILLLLLLLTAHLGGAWSNWGHKYSVYGVRFIAFVLALSICACGVLIRVRLSKMSFF